jgi:hypothetical protein
VVVEKECFSVSLVNYFKSDGLWMMAFGSSMFTLESDIGDSVTQDI